MKFKVFLIFCIWAKFSFAQTTTSYSDAGMWSTFAIDYSLNKKWSIAVAEEFRLRENYSRLNLFYTNIGIEYSPFKFLKSSLTYRFINKWEDENRFTFRHRLMWDITTKYKYQKWAFSYRHRLQGEYRSYFTDELGKLLEIYSRSKVEVGYSINKKLSTYISTEMRYQIHDYRRMASEDNWHRIRFQGGFNYNLSKYSKLGAYYLVQQVFNVTNLENIYITGIEYSINLNELQRIAKKNNKKKKRK